MENITRMAYSFVALMAIATSSAILMSACGTQDLDDAPAWRSPGGESHGASQDDDGAASSDPGLSGAADPWEETGEAALRQVVGPITCARCNQWHRDCWNGCYRSGGRMACFMDYCGGGANVRECVSFCDRSYSGECARVCSGR